MAKARMEATGHKEGGNLRQTLVYNRDTSDSLDARAPFVSILLLTIVKLALLRRVGDSFSEFSDTCCLFICEIRNVR